MRKQAYSAVEALENWTSEISRLAPKRPWRKARRKWYVAQERDLKGYLELWLVVIEQAEDVSNAIRSLREYYRLKRPYLDNASQLAFEAFDKQVTLTYERLSLPLREYRDGSSLATHTLDLRGRISDIERRIATSRPKLHWLSVDDANKENAKMNAIVQAVHGAQQSDALRVHLARLDAELDKLARRRS
jgi:hypothetical protein